jgi:hypothetical protein
VLFAVGIALGGFGLLSALESFSSVNALLYGGVFAFAALIIWGILQISDLDPKPASMVIAAFAGGVLIATSIVQTMSGSLGPVFSKVVSNAAWGHCADSGDRRGVLRRSSWCCCSSSHPGGGDVRSTVSSAVHSSASGSRCTRTSSTSPARPAN